MKLRHLLTAAMLTGSQLLFAQATKIYWGNGDTDEIYVVNPDGTGKETLTSAQNPAGLHINSRFETVYWGQSTEIFVAPVNDFGEKNDIIIRSPQRHFQGMASDPVEDKLYWTEWWTGGINFIMRSDLDGSNVDTVDANVHKPFDIAIDVVNRKIYYADQPDTILRANMDGSNREAVVVLDASSEIYGVAVSPVHEYIFWTDWGTKMIMRSDFSGDNIDTLAILDGGSAPSDIVVDEATEKVYWSDYSSALIHRSNFDGSDVESISNTLSANRFDIGDFTLPEIASITRDSPIESVTDAESVVFRVTFSEPVFGVTSDDFEIEMSGTVTGTVGGVAHVEKHKVYYVEVQSVQGEGQLGLGLLPGNDIMDFRGNPAATAITGTTEVYHIETAVVENPSEGENGNGNENEEEEVTTQTEMQLEMRLKAYIEPVPGNVVTLVSSSFKSNASVVSVYDLPGRKIGEYRFIPAGEKIEVPLGQPSHAVLIMKVQSGKQIGTVKILKQ